MSWKNCCIAASPVWGIWIGIEGAAEPSSAAERRLAPSKEETAAGEGEGGIETHPPSCSSRVGLALEGMVSAAGGCGAPY